MGEMRFGKALNQALSDAMAADDAVTEVIAAPGNPGMARAATLHPVDPLDPAAVAALAAQEQVDLVVVDTRDGSVLDRDPLEGVSLFSVGTTLAPDGMVLVPTFVGTLHAFRPLRGTHVRPRSPG